MQSHMQAFAEAVMIANEKIRPSRSSKSQQRQTRHVAAGTLYYQPRLFQIYEVDDEDSVASDHQSTCASTEDGSTTHVFSTEKLGLALEQSATNIQHDRGRLSQDSGSSLRGRSLGRSSSLRKILGILPARSSSRDAVADSS